MTRKVTALVPIFGSNRMLASNVGKMLEGCDWVGIPCGGGMCELQHIKASEILVGDKHRHIMNLACVVAEDGNRLAQRLEALPIHPDVLRAAQEACEWRERHFEDGGYTGKKLDYRIDWAVDYFVCAWMGRSGNAGTDGEFSGQLSFRWKVNDKTGRVGGGSSAKRFRSATEAIADWQAIMRRCMFFVGDVRDFLDKCKDQKGVGIYYDPPFPREGGAYKHKMTIDDHREIAKRLTEFENARVVCRFYADGIVKDLYPIYERGGDWEWHKFEGRKQTNAKAPEVLLVRN